MQRVNCRLGFLFMFIYICNVYLRCFTYFVGAMLGVSKIPSFDRYSSANVI
jgi:hypothetical protein